MAHTPGPWGAEKTEVFQHSRGGEDGVVLADVVSDNYAADARLIAAAPDLLACCTALYDMAAALNHLNGGDWLEYQRRLSVLVAAKSVIAKAEGRTDDQ